MTTASLDTISEDEDHVMPAPSQPSFSVNDYKYLIIGTVAYIR